MSAKRNQKLRKRCSDQRCMSSFQSTASSPVLSICLTVEPKPNRHNAWHFWDACYKNPKPNETGNNIIAKCTCARKAAKPLKIPLKLAGPSIKRRIPFVLGIPSTRRRHRKKMSEPVPHDYLEEGGTYYTPTGGNTVNRKGTMSVYY